MSQINALSYATMQNNAIDPASLNYFQHNLNPVPPVTNFSVANHQEEALNELNQILQETSVKRACCLGSTVANVRIPLPPNAEISESTGTGTLEKQYKYYDESVNIYSPCPSGYNSAGQTCDNFYEVYCKNIVNEFSRLNNGDFNYSDFLNYKPECACFAPIPEWLTNTGINIVPKCFLPGCAIGQSNVYLDPQSRNTGNQCDLSICYAKVDVENITAEEAGIYNKIELNCGNKFCPKGSTTCEESTGGGGGGGGSITGKITKYLLPISISLVSVCFVAIAIIIILVLLRNYL